LNNAGDTKHKHIAEEEGYAIGDTNTLPEKDGRERCGPVETTPMKDEWPAGEEKEREREREREALGGKMEKITPLNAF